MSVQDPKLQQKAQYWSNRRTLQDKTRQMETALAAGRIELLGGHIPAARPLFLEAQAAERDAQQLAQATNMPDPSGRVAAALSQAIRETYDAIVQGELINAASIRLLFQNIAELEHEISADTSSEALVLLPKALFEKSEQATRQEQFGKAEEYLDQIVDLDPENIEARIRSADSLLARARYARSKAGDNAAALGLVNKARAAYEQLLATPEFAVQRGNFERELLAEQVAANFAAGEQARKQGQLSAARQYFQLVPASSLYAAEAREQLDQIARALARRTRFIIIGAAVLVAAIALTFGLLQLRRPAATPTTVALATTMPSATAPADPTAAAPSAAPNAPPAPTAIATTPLSSTDTSVATATPKTILKGKITNEGVEVYKTTSQKNAEALFIVAKDSDWDICSELRDGSYLIGQNDCTITFGWVNRTYIKLRSITITPIP